MLRSGSDRIGALDFQASPFRYVPRESGDVPLNHLLESSERVEHGVLQSGELALALLHGTSVGGARPKALVEHDNRKMIAKFSTSADTYNVIKAEFIAMRLARIAGLDTAPVELVRIAGRDVLLVERFDRRRAGEGWARRAMVSALTLLGLDELMAAHASYEDLADIVRARFTAPKATLRELFSRMTFNILVGNTDDHARNHAAFWDGDSHRLTPAYDICPQPRTGYEASQGMRIHGSAWRSQLSLCLAAANRFHLADDDAVAIMKHQIGIIRQHWDEVCATAELSDSDRQLLWRRQFLNDLAFEGMTEQLGDAVTGLA